jgi:hypothetical protein
MMLIPFTRQQCYSEEGDANKLKLTLVPGGAGGRVFNAELLVTARDQSDEANTALFACTESSRQVITVTNSSMNPAFSRELPPNGAAAC